MRAPTPSIAVSATSTNARNYPGLNFDADELEEGIAYAHARDCKVLVAINTFPRAGNLKLWHEAVDIAADLGADAAILADIGVLDYACRKHPDLRRHLSVQAAASNPPRSLLPGKFRHQTPGFAARLDVGEIAALIARIGVEAEVFAFGSLGTMVEGRCYLSSYITGLSPSCDGACAPASTWPTRRRATSWCPASTG